VSVLSGATTRHLLAVGAVGSSAYWAMMSSQSQLLGGFPSRGVNCGSARRPLIALTFDDGPNEPYTSRLVDLLGRRDVRATFFLVGKAVARYPETSAALVAAGHVVGNHSYSHELRRCLSGRLIDSEIRRTQDVISDTIQLLPRLYRPPWLVRTPATFASLRRHHLVPVSGTFCHPLEVAQCAPERIATRAVARSTPGGMLIFHDGYNGEGASRTRTLDAVARVIDVLGERGWGFTTVDQMLGVAPYLRGREVAECSPSSLRSGQPCW
jgi:peptidoglycan/xylan/chitin deacetylase (PgdA/CDA1 family)